MPLRDYQIRLVGAVMEATYRGVQRQLFIKPTGTGKTQGFVAVESCFPGKGPALVLAHQEELVTQAAKRFQAMNPRRKVGIEKADFQANPECDVVVASVPTIGRKGSTRLSWMQPDGARPARLVICDEAHHAPASQFQNVFHRFGCFTVGKARLLGCTATPKRLDKINLNSIFEEVVFQYTIREAVADGFLCPVRGWRVKTEIDLSGLHTSGGDFRKDELVKAVNVYERTLAAIRHWQEVAKDRPTVVFCVDIEHLKATVEAFNANGIEARGVWGAMEAENGKGARKETIEAFRAGKFPVLVNVQLLTEGVDIPEISCIIMLRPTQSWAFYMQAVGRGLRGGRNHPIPGKTDLIVLDVVDVTKKHDLATIPSILDLPTDLDLEGHTIEEAAELLDEMTEKAAGMAKPPKTFTDIKTSLEAIDLLGGQTLAPVVESFSRFAWTMLFDGSYHLSCGSAQERDYGPSPRRTARLARAAMSGWFLTLKEGKDVVSQLEVPENNPGDHFPYADDLIESVWPEASRVASRTARWRTDPISEGQKNMLRKYGYGEEQIENLTKGQAGALLDMESSKKRPGRRNVPTLSLFR